MHRNHIAGPLDDLHTMYNKATCYNPECNRTFSYVAEDHLFCTQECFAEYVKAHKLDITNAEGMRAHFKE